MTRRIFNRSLSYTLIVALLALTILTPHAPLVSRALGQVGRGYVGNFRPSDIPNCKVWGAADLLSGATNGATVTTFTDESGNAASVTQGTSNKRATYKTSIVNGKPVLRFDGNDDEYTIPTDVNVSTQNFTFFMVGRKNTFDLGAQEVYLKLGATGNLGFQNYQGALFNFAGGGTITSTLKPDQNHGLIGVVGGPSSSIFYYNDQTDTQAAFASATTTSVLGYLGSYNASFYLYGDVAEWVLYDRALSAAEVTQLKTYLISKYNLLTPQPNQICFNGDSLTRGVGALDSYPTQVMVSLGTAWRFRNYGIGGQTIATMNTNYAAGPGTFYSGSYTKKVYAFWGGTNDIYFGADGATTYSRLVTQLTAAKASGYYVIFFSMLPRSNGGTPAGFETERQSFLTSVRADFNVATAFSQIYGPAVGVTYADLMIDLAANTTIGDAGDENNTTYYADKVHLTDAGYAIPAGYLIQAMTLVP